jgi:hypothetical protein
MGLTNPPTQWVPGACPLGVKQSEREADHSPLAPRLRMRGAVTHRHLPSSGSTAQYLIKSRLDLNVWEGKCGNIAHLPQQCHNSKCAIIQKRLLKVLKCYNFLWVQWRHNCSPAASFANWVLTIYLLKMHLQTFLSIPITQKCQYLCCDTLVADERYY